MLVGLLLSGCEGRGAESDVPDTRHEETAAFATWHRDADGDDYGDPDLPQEAVDPPAGFVSDGTDCDDNDASVFPGAPDTCNDLDDDCDGQIDEGIESSPWFLDADGDGWGSDAEMVLACAAPEGRVAGGGDCDDADRSVYPGAADACENGADEDCDGTDARCRLEGVVDLSTADAKYLGGTAGDGAGGPLACGGDVDGDGFAGVLIGEREQLTDDYSAGDSLGGGWLLDFSSPGVHDLDTYAVPIWGDSEGPFQGAMIFVPDTDGDGLDDVLMGSPQAQEAYLFRGPIGLARSRSDADSSISHPAGGLGIGRTAVSIGDGAFALAGVGNLYQDGEWGALVGGAFVFDAPIEGDVTTDEASASLAPSRYHEYGYFGWSMCSGDLDGDGEHDLVIGAPSPYPTSYPDFMEWGVVYVLHGPFSGDIRVAEADGTLADADARIQGSNGGANIGGAVSCGGDADGDGHDDILIGRPDWRVRANARGEADLFVRSLSGIVDVDDHDGRISGADDADYLGSSVSLDADLDGDGRHDALVASYADASRGEVSLFYGGFAGVLDLTSADAVIQGEAQGDYAGAALAGCPDIDGDGFDDLLIGAGGESTNGTWAGAAYLLYGGGG